MPDLPENRRPSLWFRRLACFFGTPVLLIVVSGVIHKAIEVYRGSNETHDEYQGEDSMSSPLPHVIPFKALAKRRRVPAKLPQEIADFYAENEGYCPVIPEYIVGLYPLKSVGVGDGRVVPGLEVVYGNEPDNAWLHADVVHLGQDSFGDDIFWARSTPARSDGGIYLVGYDVAGPVNASSQDGHVLCVAASFTSWLDHLRENEWIEYGVVPGEMKNLPKAKREKLRRHYAALNGKLSW